MSVAFRANRTNMNGISTLNIGNSEHRNISVPRENSIIKNYFINPQHTEHKKETISKLTVKSEEIQFELSKEGTYAFVGNSRDQPLNIPSQLANVKNSEQLKAVLEAHYLKVSGFNFLEMNVRGLGGYDLEFDTKEAALSKARLDAGILGNGIIVGVRRNGDFITTIYSSERIPGPNEDPRVCMYAAIQDHTNGHVFDEEGGEEIVTRSHVHVRRITAVVDLVVFGLERALEDPNCIILEHGGHFRRWGVIVNRAGRGSIPAGCAAHYFWPRENPQPSLSTISNKYEVINKDQKQSNIDQRTAVNKATGKATTDVTTAAGGRVRTAADVAIGSKIEDDFKSGAPIQPNVLTPVNLEIQEQKINTIMLKYSKAIMQKSKLNEGQFLRAINMTIAGMESDCQQAGVNFSTYLKHCEKNVNLTNEMNSAEKAKVCSAIQNTLKQHNSLELPPSKLHTEAVTNAPAPTLVCNGGIETILKNQLVASSQNSLPTVQPNRSGDLANIRATLVNFRGT